MNANKIFSFIKSIHSALRRNRHDEYLLFRLRKNQIIYNLFSVITVILVAVTLIVRAHQLLEKISIFIILVIYGALLLMLIIITLKKIMFQYNSIFFTIMLISVFAIIVEWNAVSNEQTRTSLIQFYSGMITGNFLTFMTIFQISWIENAMISLAIQIYASARILSAVGDSENYPALIVNFLLLIITTGFYYRFAQINRLQYEELRIHQRESEFFAFLLREVFPSPILVIKSMNYEGKYSITYNRSAKEMFRIENEDDLSKKLNEMLFSSFSEERTPMNFSDIIEKYTAESLPKRLSKSVYFENFRTKHTNQDEEGNKEEYFWEIKVGNILWQKERAVFFVLNDKTDDQKLKEIREMMDKNKDKLLATVSHELRTPLNGIIGMIDHVKDSLPNADNKMELGIALKSARWLLHMINDILDFSRLANGNLNLNMEESQLKDLLQDVTKLIKFQIKHKGLKLVEDYDEIENLYTYCDPNRLRQILMNLLGNALKFTSKGFIKVSVKTNLNSNRNCIFTKDSRRSKEEYQEISLCNSERRPLQALSDEHLTDLTEIVIEDSGLGISDEDIPRLFKLFGKLKQGDPKVNREGVGLGLAISQNLAQMMLPESEGGGIRVESVVGKGSKFSFKLKSYQRIVENIEMNAIEWDINAPLEIEKVKSFEVADSSSFETQSNNKRSQLRLQKMKSLSRFFSRSLENILVLVVDDDQINQLVLKKYLSELGLDIRMASNGQEALDLTKDLALNGQFFKLVLMDCSMPVMDGYEASRRIIDFINEGVIPPVEILVLTANASNVEESRFLEVGVSHFLTKPLFKKTFQAKVRQILIPDLD